MAGRAVERYFWILEALLLVASLGIGAEVVWQNSLRKQCASDILLITQQAQEYWQCTPKELEEKYKRTVEKLEERVSSLNKKLFWMDEVNKNGEGAGIEFMRRVKQVESRLKNTFPQAKFPNNLGFPTQMPSVEKIPYYNYYLNLLERILPIVLAKGSELKEIIPVVDLVEGDCSLFLEFNSDLAVLLDLFRELNSAPIINLNKLEIRPEDDEREILSIKVGFSPFVKSNFLQVNAKNLVEKGTDGN